MLLWEERSKKVADHNFDLLFIKLQITQFLNGKH